ncbi:DNA primase large subunit-like isoform X4 [Uloborus diversus]|nr:DNA primase large subunit-like isoform X4 [Uloborus diversus]
MGYVRIPLEKIRILLSSNFQEILTQGLTQMQSSVCMQELEDPRIKSMRQDVLRWFYQPMNSSSISQSKLRPINITNLSCESMKFPLCMANLHEQLVKHHRLRHFSRIQYTLFLKEIGLSCQDAISLFMKEYSLPSDKKCRTNSSCSHSWSENRNRYIYSIEHLYGKKGAGKDYKGHSCHSLQRQHSNSFGDGGCPFVSFDADNLEKSLKSYKFEMPDIEDIKSLVSEQKYNEACFRCLKTNLSRHYQPNTTMGKTKISSCNFSSNHMIINNYIPAKKCSVNNSIWDDSFLQAPTRPSNYYFTLSNFGDFFSNK